MSNRSTSCSALQRSTRRNGMAPSRISAT
jgi:hypothetical protein